VGFVRRELWRGYERHRAARDNGAGRQVQQRRIRAIAVAPASARSCAVESARLGRPRPNRHGLVVAGPSNGGRGKGQRGSVPFGGEIGMTAGE
jgi:hypothetical protein